MNHPQEECLKDDLYDLIEKCLVNHGPWAVSEYLSIFNHATCITKDGDILGANQSFSQLCEYDKKELEGMHAIDLTYIGDHQLLQQVLAHNSVKVYPLRLKTKTGKVKHMLVSPFFLTIKGEIYRFAEFMDLTDRVEAETRNITLLSQSITALSYTVEKRDPYTVGHMNRTGQIAEKIALELGLDGQRIVSLMLGAKVHDIGKIAIPTEILIKPTQLDNIEWEFMKRHPSVGYDIIADLELSPTIKDIVHYHHEYYDGSGYPEGITSDKVSLDVNIITVADSLDAISGVRPYRSSKTFDEAITIMQEFKQRYHPDVLNAAADLVHNKVIAGTEFYGEA